MVEEDSKTPKEEEVDTEQLTKVVKALVEISKRNAKPKAYLGLIPGEIKKHKEIS